MGSDGRAHGSDYKARWHDQAVDSECGIGDASPHAPAGLCCHQGDSWRSGRLQDFDSFQGSWPKVTGSSNASKCPVPAPFFEADAHSDPIEQFRTWYEVALKCDCAEPTAMTVATATPDGKPSARVVLLKHFDQRGFVFFTNYESRKGAELAQNPRAALLFYWDSLRRQVRIEGTVELVSPAESDKYFASRSYESQLSASASPPNHV